MLLKIIKNKWTYFIILGLFVVVPIGIQISQVYFGDQTPHGDWLGFWGSYLGIIPSGLIAYAVAKVQIDQQRKDRDEARKNELLPYFNIIKLIHGSEARFTSISFQFIVSSKETSLPVINADIRVFLISESRKHRTQIVDIQQGHVFPGTEITVDVPTEQIQTEPDAYMIDRIDIKASLVDGRLVFFSWGDGADGVHIVSGIDKQWTGYLDRENASLAIERYDTQRSKEDWNRNIKIKKFSELISMAVNDKRANRKRSK